MALLLSKSEADRPLYLAIACEELRVLGEFERVNERIRSLPDSIAALIGQVLQRLEKDHGQQLIANVLSLIACSRHGLLESELLELLKCDGEEQLPQAIWARAYRSLKAYLRSSGEAHEGEIAFFHQQLQWAVEQRYLPTPNIEAERHLQLAQYFRAKADPERDASFIGSYPRAFAELPYQLSRAGKKEDVENLLLTCRFLESKVGTFGPEPLIQDYDLRVIRKGGGDSAVSASEPHRLVQRALTQSSVPLLKDPSQLTSQLYGRLLRTDERGLRTFRQELRSRLKALIPLSALVAQVNDPFIWRVEVNRYVSALAVSQDGRALFSGSSQDSIIRMWDIDSRREMRRLEGHKDEVTALALSGDACMLFSASRDKTIRVWDVESGCELRLLLGHTEWVRCLALSRGERTLYSAALDSTVRVWDVESGRELHRIDGCKPPFALSDDGHLLFCPVSNGIEPWNNVIRVWDLTADHELCRLAESEEWLTVMAMVCGADGQSVIFACGDKTVRAWDVESRREVRRFLGHRETVYSLALSADGRTLFTGSLDNTIRAWDLEGRRELYRIAGHGDAVDALALSTKRAMLFSGSADGTIRGWDLRAAPAALASEGHTRTVTAIAFDRSGRLLFSGSYDRTLRAWDTTSGREMRRFEGHENYVTALAVSEDGSIVYSASWDTTIRKWSVLSGLELQQFDVGIYPLTALALSRDGKTLVSAQEDGSIVVWDIERGCVLRNFEGCHGDIEEITKVVLALTADGRTLFSGDGNVITAREMDDAGQTRFIETADVTALALSTNELSLYCGSSDHAIRVLDVKNGHELQRLEGHGAEVTALMAIADGRTLISASVDCTVKAWQVESGECTATFYADAGILSLASGPNGIIAAGDDAGHIGLFRIDTSASVRRSASA
jgi:WD40 repeat protein